jgi:hypothetical protein
MPVLILFRVIVGAELPYLLTTACRGGTGVPSRTGEVRLAARAELQPRFHGIVCILTVNIEANEARLSYSNCKTYGHSCAKANDSSEHSGSERHLRDQVPQAERAAATTW